jgi:alpha/beta superfamily hydrolase
VPGHKARKWEVFPHRNVTIEGERRSTECRYYPSERPRGGVIWVGGVSGGWGSPARNLYERLSEELVAQEVSSLRVKFREPGNFSECLFDVLAGVEFLESEGIQRAALVGHSFGGAVVIQAALLADSIKAVIALATQSYGTEAVEKFREDCALFLVHGEKDSILPSISSKRVYLHAHAPKKLQIHKETGHQLEESADRVRRDVRDWILNYLA